MPQAGASDFVAKPFQFDELLHVLQNALEHVVCALRMRIYAPNSKSAINLAASWGAAGR
jgi:FixJ family two-component response regulator